VARYRGASPGPCAISQIGNRQMGDGRMGDGKMGDGKMGDGKMGDGKMGDNAVIGVPRGRASHAKRLLVAERLFVTPPGSEG
jgi:uncharacterized low-complexity protein